MNALTLYAAWAWAMCWASKPVENRTWAPPRSACGKLLAIHAGKTIDSEAVEDIACEVGITPEDWTETSAVRAHRSAMRDGPLRRAGRLSPGCVVGVGLLAGWVCDDGTGYIAPGVAEKVGLPEAEILRRARASFYYNGPYGWIVVNRVALPEPVPCRGAQGLWTLPPDVEAAVARLPGGAPWMN